MGNRRATTAPSQPQHPRDAWALAALQKAGLVEPASSAAWAAAPPEWLAVAAVRSGASPSAVRAALAQAAHVQEANLAEADPAAAHFIPEGVARQYCALPLTATNRSIRVATASPLDLDAEQALGFVAGRHVDFLYALPDELAQRLDEVYRPEKSVERLVSGLGTTATVEAAEEAHVYETGAAVDAPVAKLVDAVVSDAVREGASDIHFEPSDQGLVVRYRVDGVLREVMRVPRSAASSVVRRLKIVGRLDISDPLHPHDGRASARVDGKPWDLRISSIPIARYGEKVVARILDPESGIAPLDRLGLWPDELAALEALLKNREGIVLVTGPTGSGKTTTLYSALDRIRTPGLNVVTVEDPVEYRLAGVNQVQVNEKQGFTFAGALRSVLRQDPDIVLLGEIRDEETARTAWQAGMSGHFVLSTLHTNDSLTSVARLADLGVDAFKIASALKGVLAQRLLRRLCPKCAEPAGVESLPAAVRPPRGFDRPVRVMAPKGCGQCGFSGYRGRVAIEEILTVDGPVADLIARGALGEPLVAAARRAGMRTLAEAALRRVWVGETSFAEMARVVGHPAEPKAPEEPAAQTAGRPEDVVPAAPPAEAAPQPLVLVADDDPKMRKLVSSILTAQGLRVAEAEDGIEALEEARRLHPALMLLDMEMPRLDGLGVLDTLRQRLLGRAVPVVVVTAQDDPAVESRCIELGAEDYITKPIQPASLVARVRAVLRRVGASS